MSDFTSQLPSRPSLEQLHKQAKDLLRQYRAGDPAAIERIRAADPRLADAQFALAREYGFESWAKLKQHVEGAQHSSLDQFSLDKFELLAKQLAAAYSSADFTAIREINWNLGTSFVWYHEPEKMHQRLTTWFASETRTPELALADARGIVAHSYGFESWAKFEDSVAQPPRDPRSAPVFMSSTPPFYQIEWKDNAISVRGPQSERDWDTIVAVMAEHRITKLNAGGITDAGMERVARLDQVTSLQLGNSNLLTDSGLSHLAQMPQLQELDVSGWKGVITDRGLAVLCHLTELREFQMCWQQNVSDVGIANLSSCHQLERVNLMGTPTGDGGVEACVWKPNLRRFNSGRGVTDAGLVLFHRFPVFKTWQGGDADCELMRPDAGPNHLLVDGPFTDQGLAGLAGLDGLFGLSFFWHCPAFTAAGLEPLKHLAHLGLLGCEGERCDDDAMRHIAAMPRLRKLMAQGTVATDAGFEALSRSRTIESIWGRDCPNLTGRGFMALAAMPSLRGLSVSCKNVDDAALSILPRFPALREFMPMDVPDEGFRHVGRCKQLEKLTCMYCRDTGDTATEYIAGLSRLKTYYAGSTLITDRSLEILGRMHSLERLEFWACAGITDVGMAALAGLPRLRDITLDGLPGVTRAAAELFPAHVRVTYSG